MNIMHLSDLHFPKIDQACLEALKKAAAEYSVELVIVTGDITQRAQKTSFKKAFLFFNELKVEKIFLPGNHDIPTFRFWERIVSPYALYREYFHPELENFYIGKSVVVAGLNTSRPYFPVNGRISHAQLDETKILFREHPDKLKIVATHHILARPKHVNKHVIMNSRSILANLASLQPDVFLSGHSHVSSVIIKKIGNGEQGFGSVFIQAGTLSHRLREETTSFNILEEQGQELILRRFVFEAGVYRVKEERKLHKKNDGWLEL